MPGVRQQYALDESALLRKIFVPVDGSTNCPALHAIAPAGSEWRCQCDVSTSRGFLTFTSCHRYGPSAAATCSISTVHCAPVMFHALRTTIVVDRADYRAGEANCGPESHRSSPDHLRFTKGSLGRRPGRCGAIHKNDRPFIYLSAGYRPGAKAAATRGVIFILQTLNKARPRRSTLETTTAY